MTTVGDRMWAARVAGRLVVVQAPSASAAGEASGLTLEFFTPATDADLIEWETLIDEPLEERELRVLQNMIWHRCRAIGRRRLLNRRKGRFVDGGDPSADSDLATASRLVVAAAKIAERIAEIGGVR